ncbi:hypothetical protein GCM10009737_08160 [Nocardioides lentus]|uniref:Uncharacterized protein n=1 Tax=Nocardioides lentus TaxID=338077 RepID=A0ABN2P3J0_9ACTN
MVVRTIVPAPSAPGVPSGLAAAMQALTADVAAARDAATAANQRAAEAEQRATAADDRAGNAQQMVRNRDGKLDQASSDAANALLDVESLTELAEQVLAAKTASEEDRAALHRTSDQHTEDLAGLHRALDAITGRVNRTAIGLRGSVALAVNTPVPITVSLSRPMPTTDYEVTFAHSVATAGQLTYTDIVRTKTTVTVKVTASALITAGTFSVLAW